VRTWLSNANGDPHWKIDTEEADVRVLVLVHRMAAKRLGFSNVHAALNEGANNSLEGGWLDGSTWVVRPFLTCLLPLAAAAQAGAQFDVISLLRVHCPLLQLNNLPGKKVSALLATLKLDVEKLVVLLTTPSVASIQEILNFVRERQLMTLDDRFLSFLDVDVAGGDDDDVAVTAFLACPAIELWSYQTYINDLSPYATQQGIKGAEFERVLVILDDEEGTHSHFSYGKYFGIQALSDTDNKNIVAGKDSALDRTRRLFYVCCSRARRDLAVVLFVPDVEAALPTIIARGLFPTENIYTADALEG
jgi:DNA helicase-2/ATP-dependent DNA helicase PcrA